MSAATSPSHGQRRPAISVILPFHGSAADADAALAALARLQVRDDDEILVADNTVAGTLLGRPGVANVTAFACAVKQSAYAARNLAAERARHDWLLFLDADCVPVRDLLDRYFAPAPAPRTGAVAGQVLGRPDQPGLIPAYVRARRHLDQRWLHEEHPYRPMAVTANLLVRRAAFTEIGGFAELTRSGADADLCWRLLDGGWELELREEALAHHEHRATLPALLRQSVRDGAGARWLSRRHPGFPARPAAVCELMRAVAGALAWTLRGHPHRGLHKLIDGAWVLAAVAGSWQTNAAPTGPAQAREIALLDRFPSAGDPLLAALASDVRVEARGRPSHPDWATGRRRAAHLEEDDGPAHRLAALATLMTRHPLAVVRVLAGAQRRRAIALAPAARRLRRDPASTRIVAAPDRRADALVLARLAGRGAGVGQRAGESV